MQLSGASAATGAASEPPTRHVAHVDGLRAVAVLSVIAYHLRDAWLPGGFVGVDVFFVISGFVVSRSVAGWHGGGVGRFLAYFYARRIQRIVPALLACLLGTMLLTALFVPVAWLGIALERTASYAFFGLSNFFLASHRESYFSPTLDYNPYMHTWSLGVEEQFYLLFPLLFYAWTRGRSGRRFASAATIVALVASYAWATSLAARDATSAFYLIGSRLWELAAGVLLFQRSPAVARWPARLRSALAWCGALLLAFALATSEPARFPAPHPLLAVVATIALLAGLHANGRALLARALGAAPMAWIGRASYSLYLWHWPVFVLLRWTVGLETPLQLALGLAATFGLAWVSMRYIEQPFRYAGWLQRWPRIAVVAAGIALVCASWALGNLIASARPQLSLSTVTRNLADWHPNPDATLPGQPGCRLAISHAQTGTAKRVGITTFSRAGCAAGEPSAPRIVVMGDSHATALRKMLSRYTLATGAEVVFYQNDHCTFASLQPEREGGLCPDGNRAALAHLLAHAREGDVLLLAALRLARWTDQFALRDEVRAWRSMTSTAALAARQRAADALAGALAPVAAKRIRIALLAPTPILSATPYRCADWFNAGNPICARGLEVPREALLRYRAQVMDGFATVLARVDTAAVWDPFFLLCPASTCGAFLDGRPLLADGDHLSGHANVLLLPSFLDFVATLPPPPPPPGDVIWREDG